MRIAILGALAAATLLAGCDTYDNGRPGYADAGYSRYDYDHPDPAYNGYYADRYYRHGGRYRDYHLTENDRVYVGQNGRYYCRRSDGTTGLIVGGIAGGVLGSIIAPGGSETLGALLGAAGGAVAGKAIDRNNVTCR